MDRFIIVVNIGPRMSFSMKGAVGMGINLWTVLIWCPFIVARDIRNGPNGDFLEIGEFRCCVFIRDYFGGQTPGVQTLQTR